MLGMWLEEDIDPLTSPADLDNQSPLLQVNARYTVYNCTACEPFNYLHVHICVVVFVNKSTNAYRCSNGRISGV